MGKFHFVIFGVIFLVMLPGGTWAQPQQQSTFVTQAHEREGEAAQQKNQDPQVAELASDLQRMRVLLNQMRMNLGFVQNTTTPLKHQFELEVDMWEIVINRMERRLERMSGKQAPR